MTDSQPPQSALEDHAKEAPVQDEGPVYWAASPPAELVQALADRERRYFDFAQRRGYMGMWRVALEEFYGSSSMSLGFDAQSVGFEGQEGELTRFRVAELRSHIRQVVAMNTKNRPAFKATPTNMDYDTRAEIDSAETGIEYVYRSAHGERKEREACELSEVLASFYTWIQWDPNGGQELLVPTKLQTPEGAEVQGPMQQAMSGTIVCKGMMPWEQFCDPLQRDQTLINWRTIRERANKWESAAKYPQYAAFLKSQTFEDQTLFQMGFTWQDRLNVGDDILLKHFYHARTPALPEGRYVVYCGTTVIYDSSDAGTPEEPKKTGLPYAKVPVVPLVASSLVGSCLGYSDSWDLVVLQQMLTQSTSDMATTINTYGHPAMVLTKGTDIDENALVNGTFMLTKPVGADSPEYIQPPTIPAGQFDWLKWLLQFFREISGLNAVMRGDTSSEIKSGQHAALYHAIAQEFQTERLAALAFYREEVGNMMLDILKRFAEQPFFAEIAGIDERNHIKAFTREKFMGIRRVTLESVKPSSMAQNMEVATFLQQMQAFETPDQAIEFIHTGKLKPWMRSAHSRMMRVQWENDEIAQGKVSVQQILEPNALGIPEPQQVTPEIPVFATDNPFIHVPEVLSLLDSPEAVNNAAIRDAVFAHVRWHLRVYAEMTPDMCAILKIPPPAAGMQMLQEQASAASGGKKPPKPGKTQEEQVGQEEFATPKAAKPPQGANVDA